MTFEVDASAFTAMCRELADRLEVPPDEVLREEVGKVLSQTITNTTAASADKIRQHQAKAQYTLQPPSLYPAKHPERRHLKNGRVLYNLSRRYPNALWSAIQAAREQDLKVRLAAIGLAKQSWLRIAEMFGLSVEAPRYVQQAKTKKQYTDEKATIHRQSGSVYYELENSQPTVNLIGGEKALQKAIDGRVLFFLNNIRHDVFRSLDAIAKKYPGVTVHDG